MVLIRIRKLGVGENVLNFRVNPETDFVSNIVASIENGLSTSSNAGLQQAVNERTKIFENETLSAVHGKTETAPPRYSTNDLHAYYLDRAQERMGEAFREAQRACAAWSARARW